MDINKLKYLKITKIEDNCSIDNILEIRNLTRDGFISQETITKEEHYNFMNKYSKDYFVIGYTLPCGGMDEIVGFVGVVNGDIRFALRPEYQGYGLGKKLLLFIKEKYPNAIGKVKINNAVSSFAFIKAGFQAWFSDDQFIYYTSKNIGELTSTELHELYNKYLVRCISCSSVMTETKEHVLCYRCRHI